MPEDQIADFKTLCAKVFSPYVQSILVDPIYGNDAITVAINSGKTILLTREETGYTDNPDGRLTVLSNHFTSTKLKEMGANAIKLLMYYNSDASNAQKQIDIAKRVRDETIDLNMPFLLEIVTYPVDGNPYHKGDAIVDAVSDLRTYSDILKLEYPVDPSAEDAENAIPYLNQISSEAEQPWVLLSRGMKFDFYKKALKISKENGCKGFAVGRAVWQEVAELQNWDDKVNFMNTIGIKRMKELSDIWN